MTAAGQLRPHRRRPLRQNKLVVGLIVLPAALALGYPNALAGAVDGDGLMTDAHLYLIVFLEILRCRYQQIVAPFDLAPDMIGKAAVGE